MNLVKSSQSNQIKYNAVGLRASQRDMPSLAFCLWEEAYRSFNNDWLWRSGVRLQRLLQKSNLGGGSHTEEGCRVGNPVGQLTKPEAI